MVAFSWCWQIAFFVLVAGATVINGQGRSSSQTILPSSPCPNLFYYYTDSQASQILGTLRIPPTDSDTITIKADFRVSLYFTTKYYGSIEQIEDQNTMVYYSLQQRNQQEIKYSVHFPIQNPLPQLTKLTVNNKVVCSQTLRNIGGSYMNFAIDHTLIRPTPPFFVQFDSTNPPIPSPLVNIGCGQALQASPLILNGSPVSKGAWPWLAAIFLNNETGPSFTCGGTLISKNHVITAAHCVWPGIGIQIKPEDLLIYLGKYELFNLDERGVQQIDVSHYEVHHRYKNTGPINGNDIAVLFLRTPATFNENVKPACLWNPRNFYSNDGSVVGWGNDEYNQISKTPKLAVLPIVSQQECLRSNRQFNYFTSDTTLCAGARNGVGPCQGDSGGGMYLNTRDTDGVDKWFLRGIVSQSLDSYTPQKCDLSNYIIFTDLSKFGDWIYEKTGIRQVF